MLVGNNFETYLEQSVIKNCDVVIRKPSDNSLLLNGNNISSFSLARENLGVLSKVPTDSFTATIKGWNTISQTVKDYLMTASNYVYVGFVIENVETSTYIYLAIEKCKVNFKGDEATLVCDSYYSKSAKATNYWISLLSGVTLSTPIPINITIGELFQHYAISKARGLKSATGQSFDDCLFDLGRMTIDGNFTSNNIFDVLTEEDENDRSQIVACGIEELEEKHIISKSDTKDTHFTFYFDREYVITRVTFFYKPNASSSYTSGTGYPLRTTDYVNCMWLYPTHSDYYYAYNIYGYEANMKYVGADKVIRAEMLLDTQTTELGNLQTVCRNYYSHKQYYKITGRINPCIEPQDNIFVEGVGIIRIEEVRLNFSGGFNGEIKGRLIGLPEMENPEIIDVDYAGAPDYYGVEIFNPNSFPVTVHFSGSGSGDAYQFVMDAGEDRWFEEYDLPSLMEGFTAKKIGDLMDDFYVWFTADGYEDSDNIVYLEKDEE